MARRKHCSCEGCYRWAAAGTTRCAEHREGCPEDRGVEFLTDGVHLSSVVRPIKELERDEEERRDFPALYK